MELHDPTYGLMDHPQNWGLPPGGGIMLISQHWENFIMVIYFQYQNFTEGCPKKGLNLLTNNLKQRQASCHHFREKDKSKKCVIKFFTESPAKGRQKT